MDVVLTALSIGMVNFVNKCAAFCIILLLEYSRNRYSLNLKDD